MQAAFTIGVAGHVDHGKTTLVKTLTGIDTDRRAEEKARGLSMEAGVAELRLADGRRAALIDVPGHTDYLKNTIRGLNGVDLAVLVVAADDGVMPQTREQLEILKFFQAAAGVVVLTKTDLVDTETLELAELEVHDLLEGTFLENCPVFKFSYGRPELGARVIDGIADALALVPPKPVRAPFRLWVDQARGVPGCGTVVSGTVASGRIACNDEIVLLPSEVRTRARSLQCHACSVDQAVAGQRVGINLHRVPLKAVRRGMRITAAGEDDAATYLLNANLRVLPAAKRALKNRQRVKLYLGTAVVPAMMVMIDADRLEPGDDGLVQFRLMQPAAALPRDAFVITPLNLNTVFAGGRVLEIPREKYRAVKSRALLPALTALHIADVDAYVETLFAQCSGRLITAKALAAKTGLPRRDFESTLNAGVQKGELVYIKGHGAIHRHCLSSLQNRFRTAIEEALIKNPLRKAVGLAEIAEHLGTQVQAPLLKTMADSLCRQGRIVRLEGGYCPAGAKPALDDRHASLAAQIMDDVQDSGLTPMRPNSFWKRHGQRWGKGIVARLFNYLNARGKLIRLGDNRYLSSAALEEIKRRVARRIADRGCVTLGDCKELFGYGRSGGAHVLDYLNRIGFTERREDKHVLRDGYH